MLTPVILDCDPGYDDVFAIWVAAANPAIDLRAITTVAGNGHIEHTSLNARIACTVAGISGIPIAHGAAGLAILRRLAGGTSADRGRLGHFTGIGIGQRHLARRPLRPFRGRGVARAKAEGEGAQQDRCGHGRMTSLHVDLLPGKPTLGPAGRAG